MRKVCVLYEDQRGPTKRFGLHELVKACVYDLLGETEPWRVQQALADCRPMKGSAKLLEACRRDIDLIASDGRSVVAVFDNDEIRTDLKLPRNAPDERVVQKIREGGKNTDRLFIVLLKQNMETILEAVRDCDRSVEPRSIELALKKHMLERDILLTDLTSALKRPVRECILEKVPSFRDLVELLCREIRPPTKSRRKPSPGGKRSSSKTAVRRGSTRGGRVD
jgi:hypothetical protein